MKNISLLIILLLHVLSVNSQTNDKTETEIAEIQTNKINRILNLNEDQRNLVFFINIETAFEISDLKTKKINENEYWNKRNEIKEFNKNKIYKILDSKQKLIYDKAILKLDDKQKNKTNLNQ